MNLNDITNEDFTGNLEPQPLGRGSRVVRPSERLQAMQEENTVVVRNPRRASRTPAAGRLTMGGADMALRLQGGEVPAVNAPSDRDRVPNALVTHQESRDQWSFNRPDDGVNQATQWDDLGHRYMGPNDVLLPAAPIANQSGSEDSRALDNSDAAADDERFFSTGTRSPANGMAMISSRQLVTPQGTGQHRARSHTPHPTALSRQRSERSITPNRSLSSRSATPLSQAAAGLRNSRSSTPGMSGARNFSLRLATEGLPGPHLGPSSGGNDTDFVSLEDDKYYDSDRAQDGPPQKKMKSTRERSWRGLSANNKHLVMLACSHFKSKLATVDAFPDISGSIDDYIKESLWQAQKEFEVKCDPVGAVEYGLVRVRASQHRGNVKSLACELVPAAYGFVDPSDADDDHSKYEQIVRENRERVEMLKAKKSFVYLNPMDRTIYDSMYRNRIISRIVNATWFNGMNADGIKYASYFTPFPTTTLAFVLTAIECAIDEWGTGTHMTMKFEGKKYKTVYDSHLGLLEKWNAFTKNHIAKNPGAKNLLEGVLTDLLVKGREKAGAPVGVTGEKEEEVLSDEEFLANSKE